MEEYPVSDSGGAEKQDVGEIIDVEQLGREA